MKLAIAIAHLETNPEYLDGCTRHINCINMKDVVLGLAPTNNGIIATVIPNFVISDWTDNSTIYSYCNGQQRS